MSIVKSTAVRRVPVGQVAGLSPAAHLALVEVARVRARHEVAPATKTNATVRMIVIRRIKLPFGDDDGFRSLAPAR